MATFNPTIVYSLDGVSFTTYGVYVSGTKGLSDAPKMKDGIRYSPIDLPGEIVDLSAPQYEVKEFTIDCFIQATSALDFTTKMNTFIRALIAPVATVGTHRLQVLIDNNSPLVYQVYCPDGVAVNAKFRTSNMVGTFSIKLREPEPVKRVYRYAAPPYSCVSSIVCSKPVNIYWGDGSCTKDVLALTTTAVNHTYSGSGTRFIIITGDLESITSFSTAATLVWDKLL